MHEKWGLKYRPLDLDHILGQDHVKDIIRGALSLPDPPDAWILHGGFGSGKTTTARVLAKALICLNPKPDGQSCNQCYECSAVDQLETSSNSSLNYSEMDAPSVGNVKNIREVIEDAQLSPVNGAPHRVYLLDEAQALTRDAQGAFLKALEDGVGKTIFILATTDPDKLLPALRSRCISLNLTPVDRHTVFQHLKWVVTQENRPAEDQALELISEYNYGHIRDVLNMAYQISLAGEITLEITRKQLNLHLDDHAALLILQAGESWEQLNTNLQKIIHELTPEDLWGAIRRTLGQAYLCVIQPGREKSEIVKKLAERYGERLGPLALWGLGEGARIQIRLRDDLLVGLAQIRERLGVGGVTVARDQRRGVSKTDLRANGLVRSRPPLTEESVMDLFDLKPESPPEKLSPDVPGHA